MSSNAGCKTFEGFLKYLKTRKTRVYCLLHVSRFGLKTAGCAADGLPGELMSIDDVNTDDCLQCIANNSDIIVGIKLRLAAVIANDGINEKEAYRRALLIGTHSQLPLMVHYSFSTVPHTQDGEGHGVPGSLRRGDILTHMCHGLGSTIIDVPSDNMTVHHSVIEAQIRGVCLDIGHGKGSFNWRVAEIAGKEGIWPDTISTDLHTMSLRGPAYDLPTIMTKLLHIGMPLYDIIRAVTHTPAKVINREKMIGSFSIGSKGDVTILKIVDCDVMLEDSQQDKRHITKQFIPIVTWIGGERITIKDHCTQCS